MLVDDLIGQFQHLGGGLGVKGRGVLVQKEQLGTVHGGHEQRDCLALAAGEQADLGGQAILQTKLQGRQQLAVMGPVCLTHAAHEAPLDAALGGDGQVLGDLHIRGGALHGILEHAAQELRPLVLGHIGYVHAVDFDGAVVRLPHACDGVEQGRFACAVAADDGDEIAVLQLQIQPVQGGLGVDRACVEGLLQVGDLKHGAHLLRWDEGICAW